MTDAQEGSEREQWLELVEVPDSKNDDINAAFDVELDPRLRQLAMLAKSGAACWPSACMPTIGGKLREILDAADDKFEALRSYDELQRVLEIEVDVIAQLKPGAS